MTQKNKRLFDAARLILNDGCPPDPKPRYCPNMLCYRTMLNTLMEETES